MARIPILHLYIAGINYDAVGSGRYTYTVQGILYIGI